MWSIFLKREMLDSVTGILHVFSNASYVMFWFVVSAILLCISILVSMHFSFILLNPEYKARHFLRTEARVISEIANLVKLLVGLWKSVRVNKDATEEDTERDEIDKLYFL